MPMMTILRFLTSLAIALAAHPTAAIVIRHDRDDARYVELGARFPAAATVLPDGTGVLIAPDWVLTAGHVARGVANRSPGVEIAGQEYEVSRIFVDPRWKDMGPHDIGLLELARPVRGVTPALLYEGDDEVGQTITFVGRGDTGTGLTGPQKLDGKMRGATNVVESADDDWILFTFDEGEAATDLEGVSGPGDSGGPALLVRDGKLYTLGVSVFADGKGKGPGRYGVLEGYTRVSSHRDWINRTIAGENSTREIAIGGAGKRNNESASLNRVVSAGGASSAVELPDTPFGELVEKYVEVYNSDSEPAMAEFISAGFAQSYLDSKTEREHLDTYRRLYDQHFGALTVDHVVSEEDDALTVLFTSERGQMAEIRFQADAQTGLRIAGMRVAAVEISRD